MKLKNKSEQELLQILSANFELKNKEEAKEIKKQVLKTILNILLILIGRIMKTKPRNDNREEHKGVPDSGTIDENENTIP